MKFGDTLRSRSIPEWGHYNIDYDYLKDLIKHQTTAGTNKAVSIPGQGESTEREFRASFLQVLQAQHDRINLFVRSKSGEIERRLDHISRSLEQLRSKQRLGSHGARLPARTVERYAKIDADVTKTGEEIRSLSRFQVAQRIGFTKILKKYRRWTRDQGLNQAFKEQVTSRLDSLFQLDLGYLLDQYIDVIGAIRSVFDDDETTTNNLESVSAHSAAARISRALEKGDELDFDLAMTTIPLGSHGNRATYWIHPDHYVEAQVLILQQLRLHTSGTQTASRNQSAHATPIRRTSSVANSESYFCTNDDVGFLVLDHAEAFAFKQNASTISSTEATKGNIVFKAAGNVHCNSFGQAAVVVCSDTKGQQQATSNIRTVRLKTKSLQGLLGENGQSSGDADSKTPTQQDSTQNEEDSNLAMIKEWLTNHEEARPIVGVASKRTRFVGLHNNSAGGIWATLDKDIYMKDSMSKDLFEDDWLSTVRSKAAAFPHAVLEVRREGAQATSLIQTLDRSHLFERVRGFSMEAHAVWTCCKPSSMTTPIWLPLLEQDIRRLPEPVKRRSRKAQASAAGSMSQTSPPQSSTSNTSHGGVTSPSMSRNGETSATSGQEFVDPPSLQAFRKKRRVPFSDYPPPMVPEDEQSEVQRYWNEYDHPEDDDSGGYYIYVDPDAPVKFPGQEMFEAWAQKTRHMLGLKIKANEESLLSGVDDESSDDESPITNYGTLPSYNHKPHHEGYFSNLFQSLRNPHHDAEVLHERRSLLNELETRQHKTEMTKLRFYAMCLATSISIDIILGLMTVTSRKKERGAVDIGVVFGTVCTFLLCIVALISMKTRRERLGWIHQSVVLIVAAAIVAVDVLFLSWALRI
ncbi:hypothetical protein GQ44DRAFT_700900 [Phaeosphaeriaceae sp. PMI808]|nr:hypothetical protein GQ44DRAFT_700900 [Phaeosphaeriaceae sp. PMI808]